MKSRMSFKRRLDPIPAPVPTAGTGADVKSPCVHLSFVGVLPHSGIPDIGRFYGSRGCFDFSKVATLAKNLPRRSRSHHGFTTRTGSRHVRGDWGTLDPEDWNSNERALKGEGRLFSAYLSIQNIKFWIITECDRSVTTILLPEDY
jgi:hypothetical protein